MRLESPGGAARVQLRIGASDATLSAVIALCLRTGSLGQMTLRKLMLSRTPILYCCDVVMLTMTAISSIAASLRRR